MTLISINSLYKEYDHTELFSGFSYDFSEGGSYALISPSGSGKTTLLRIIAGLTKPLSGSISFTQKDRLIKRPQLSMVFQEDRLCEDFSAIENVCLATGIDKAAARAELSKLLPDTLLLKPVRKLSGGQRRRICIVRAMNVRSASIILMDEPFTGLDAATKELCSSYILEKKEDRTLILSTHDKTDIELLKLTPVRL